MILLFLPQAMALMLVEMVPLLYRMAPTSVGNLDKNGHGGGGGGGGLDGFNCRHFYWWKRWKWRKWSCCYPIQGGYVMTNKYCCIKNNVCTNVIVLNDNVDDFIKVLKIDYLIPHEDGFGIGDNYTNGTWSKEIPASQLPTVEERLAIAEDTINFLLGL